MEGGWGVCKGMCGGWRGILLPCDSVCVCVCVCVCVHMWQFRVEIEGYSVTYFDRIAAFKVLYC